VECHRAGGYEIRLRAIGPARQAAAERPLVSSAHHTHVVVNAVGVRMKFVVADVIARHSETAADGETRIARSVAAIRLDADIAVRKKRVTDTPGIDDICTDPKRLNNARADKQRIAESNGSRDVVVSGAVGGE